VTSSEVCKQSYIPKFLEAHLHAKIAIEVQMSTIPIYRELERNGYDDVFVSCPTKTKLIAESRRRKRQTG
jgi:hypothetical protein